MQSRDTRTTKTVHWHCVLVSFRSKSQTTFLKEVVDYPWHIFNTQIRKITAVEVELIHYLGIVGQYDKLTDSYSTIRSRDVNDIKEGWKI